MRIIQRIRKWISIVAVMMISITILGCGKSKEDKDKAKGADIPVEISTFVETLFRAIVNEDVEYIINVLYDGEIEYYDMALYGDVRKKPKREIVKDLREKGEIYHTLFDTEAIYQDKTKYSRDRDGNPSSIEELKMLYPEIHSIKDRIINRKNIRIEKIEELDKEKKIIRCHLIDDYEIEMKKKSPLSELIFLKRVDIIIVDEKIYLYSLFFDSSVLSI